MKSKYYFIGIIVISILIFLGNSIGIQKIDTIFWDQLQQVYTSPVRDDITIIAIDDNSLSKIGAWPWQRNIFAQIIDKLNQNQARVIAIDVTFLEKRDGDTELQTSISKSSTPIVLASKILDKRHLTPVIDSPYIGFTNIIQDNDGIVRSMLLNISLENKIPSFAQEIYLAYIQDHPRKESLLKWNKELQDQSKFIYEAGEFNTISAHDLINNNYDPNKIKDHIILVGSTAKDLRTGLVDNISKVGGIRISGVNLHAYIVSALLNKDILSPIPPPINISILILMALALLIIFRKIKKSLHDTIIAIVLSISIFILSIILFDYGILIPTITYISTILAIVIYSLSTRYLEERQSREFISKAFSQYMNPDLLNILLKKPELLKLGGTKKEMTILFSDIRSFTTISESLSAEKLVSLLNAYLDKMSHVIFEHAGIIDKFIGDAIMALWNAPISDKDHAKNAVKTAIAMSKALKEFNKDQYDAKLPKLAVGIGIHTGKVIVGNMGSTKRFDFTVIGDNVNLSARLEGLTKKYGVQILISQDTIKNIGKIDGYIFRKIDQVIVKGKTKSISIYEPLPETPISEKIKKTYEKAFKSYQAGDMKKALSLLEKNKKDNPSKLLSQRILSLSPLPAKWNGIWSWTAK